MTVPTAVMMLFPHKSMSWCDDDADAIVKRVHVSCVTGLCDSLDDDMFCVTVGARQEDSNQPTKLKLSKAIALQ